MAAELEKLAKVCTAYATLGVLTEAQINDLMDHMVLALVESNVDPLDSIPATYWNLLDRGLLRIVDKVPVISIDKEMFADTSPHLSQPDEDMEEDIEDIAPADSPYGDPMSFVDR